MTPLVSREVAQLLVEDLDRLSASAEHLAVRNECAIVAAILREAIERPTEPGESHHRIVNTVSPQRPIKPSINDVGLIHRPPDPAT